VRAGVRTPSKLTDMQSQHHALFDELEQVAAVLEKNYTDIQVLKTLYYAFLSLMGRCSLKLLFCGLIILKLSTMQI